MDEPRAPGDGADRMIGLELLDTYRISHVLGEGTYGRVYHASHLRMPRSYAIKVLRSTWVDHPTWRLRFSNEVIAASRLDHPNIVNVLDFGKTPSGLPYLVMNFAPGTSLTDALSDAMPVRQALKLVRQIASGLAHAHQQGVVHRDLKPDNLLVHAGHIRIVDFGIALLLDQGDEGRLTTKGMVIGTPYYMAPEQLLGRAIDERVDLYALGAILYEMLTGRRPFSGAPVDYVHQVVAGKIPAFAKRAPWLRIEPAVEDACRRLMALDPNDRPPDALTTVALVDALLRDLPEDGAHQPSRPLRGSESGRLVGTDPTLAMSEISEMSVMSASRPVRWWNPVTWRQRK